LQILLLETYAAAFPGGWCFMKPLWIVLAVIFAGFLTVPRDVTAQTQSIDITVTVSAHEEPFAGSASEHFVTFDQPVQVPGVTLGPGGYVLRLMTPSVMQVLNRDRSEVYAMFFTVPAYKAEPSNNYEMTFHRVSNETPLRIAAFYTPYVTTGYAPIFPE